MPGVLSIVESARVATDADLAIATSGNRDKQFPVIEGAGLELEWFDVVVTGDDVTRKKPDPQIYEITAEKLGLTPERCVVLEDAPAGVASAKAAGATCIAVTSSVEADKLSDADLVVESLSEVSVAQMRHMVLPWKVSRLLTRGYSSTFTTSFSTFPSPTIGAWASSGKKITNMSSSSGQ